MPPLVLAFALAVQAQYAPQPYQPYVQPAPYRAPSYHPLPSWVPPTLPPGSPSLMIPNPPAPAYPPQPYQAPR